MIELTPDNKEHTMSEHSPIIIATYNMHEGMSALNRKVQVESMAEALQGLKSDVLFLQEVQGENLRRQLRAAPRFPPSRITTSSASIFVLQQLRQKRSVSRAPPW